MQMRDVESVESKDAAGAPDAVEITQAMVEAGVDAFRPFCSTKRSHDDVTCTLARPQHAAQEAT
jgi:hypothetical protein